MAVLPGVNALGARPLPQPQQGIVAPRNIGTAELAQAEAGETLAGAGEFISKQAGILDKLAEENDKVAATDVFMRAADLWREQSMKPDGVMGKSPQELFRGGKSASELLKATETDFNRVGQTIQGKLQNERQKRLFTSLWERHRRSELDGVAKSLADRHLKFREDTRKAFGVETDRLLDQQGVEAEANWQQPNRARDQAANAIAAFAASGADPKEVQEKIDYAVKSVNSGIVRGWFNGQSDGIGALEQLISGKLDDPNVQAVWDTLSPKDRDALRSRLATDRSRMATIREAENRKAEADAKNAVETEVKAIVLDPSLTLAQRMARFDRIKNSPHISVPVAEHIDRTLREGGVQTGQDVQAKVLDVERRIRNGELRTDIQILDAVAAGGGVSDETMRTRLLPLVEAQRDKAWTDAMDWGEARLGYDKSAAAGGLQIFTDTVDKALLLRGDLIEYRQNNPAGDFMAYAKKRVAEISEAAGAKSGAAIYSLASRYEAALKGANKTAIDQARQLFLDALVNEGLDPRRALTPGFDVMQYYLNEHGKEKNDGRPKP